MRATGVDRGQRARQCATGGLESRVHDAATQKAAADFAAHAHARTDRQCPLVRGVEAEKSQRARTAAVVQRHQQLTARLQPDFAVRNHSFQLHRLTLAHVGQAVQAGLVLKAQRQMQRQVDVALQAELVQRLLRRGKRFAGAGLGIGHGTILPFLRTRAKPLIQPSEVAGQADACRS